MARQPASRTLGFTLIELLVVVTLSGVLAGVLAPLMVSAVEGYTAQSRRLTLADQAAGALTRISRELRLALPNSIRVPASGPCAGRCIEMLRTLDGGAYRTAPPGDPLDLLSADPTFDILGQLPRLGEVTTGADCASGDGDCLVVYNTGQTGADAYAGDNRATVMAVADDAAADGSDRITLTNARLDGDQPPFPRGSPGRRFYLVDTPVTFRCDPAAGTLYRYQDYGIRASQGEVDSDAELVAQGATAGTRRRALLTEGVSACAFSYQPGPLGRSGLATLNLTLSAAGETVTLLQQVHVVNVP